MFQRRLGGALAVVALAAAACTGSSPSTPPVATGGTPTGGAPTKAATTAPAPTVELPSAIGPGEGSLNLVIWAGYAERGAVDKAYDWVTPFETATSCKVTTTDMNDSNNGVSLMQSGQYDGISASGDATTRLITGGIVAPVNTALLSNYANVFSGLKGLPHNTVNGVSYGVPHGRGPNLIGYNTAKVTPAPTSWDPIWEGGAAYKGKISIYDSSIFIADAALHLMRTKPDLGIKDPYQLTKPQFDAAVTLLRGLVANQPTFWATATEQVTAYTSGDVVVGTTWQYQVNLLQADKRPIQSVFPNEGSTGWSDTWMIAKKAAHPNCMYLWMNHMMSAQANGQATVWFGEAPTSPQACAYAETIAPGHCAQTHATDEAYYAKVHYWATPQTDCADTDAATTCVSQDDWVNAWTTLRGT